LRQIIYLEQRDNIATIRDKLERAQTNEVLLVVPPRYLELRNLVNLKLLKRYAEHLAIDLALVVRDRPTQVLAREVGLVLTSSVDKGRRINLRSSHKHKPARQGADREVSEAVDQRRAQIAYAPARGRGPLTRILTLFFVLGGVGLVAAGLVFLILPGASVILVPAAETIEAEMEIVAVPGLDNINYGQGQIPAQIISAELMGSSSTPATGKRDIPDTHAEGEAVFANKTNEPVMVPKGTILRTSTGTPVRFYTVTDLELPPKRGAHGRVGIIAVQAGPSGNVKRLTINEVEGEVSFQVDAINDEPTRKGGLKRVSEVTEEDRGRVKNALLQRLQQEAYAKLQAQLEETEFIPADTVSVEIVEEKYDKEAKQIADMLTLQLHIKATGTLVGGAEANTLMLRMLESKKPEGYVLLPESLRFQAGEVVATEGASVRFEMKASGIAVSDVDESEVRRGITGKPMSEAEQYLLDRWDFEESPQLEVTPDWLGRIPWIPYRIAVEIRLPEAP